jgi:hypothetical protein
VDCWCHVAPPPWPFDGSLCTCTEEEGMVCDFPCGSTQFCSMRDDFCEQIGPDETGATSEFTCSVFPASCPAHDCTCVPGGWVSCERSTNGGLLVVYPRG